MSYLKPHEPGTEKVKAVADYSEDEKLSAINQIQDAHKKDIFEHRPINEKTAALVRELQKGTDKEGTLPPELTREKQENASGLADSGQAAVAQGNVEDMDADTGTTRGKRNK